MYSTSRTMARKQKAKWASTRRSRKISAQEIQFYAQNATKITIVAPASTRWSPQPTETLAPSLILSSEHFTPHTVNSLEKHRIV